MRTVLAFALLIGLLGGWPADAAARGGTLAGSWFVTVEPQPAPDVEAPDPFQSILNFGFARTLVETDNSVSPNSVVTLFPPDVFPPFSASDGYGSWKRAGWNRYRCRFLKFLFSEAGEPVGIIDTTLDLEIKSDGTLAGGGASDFIRGTDPEGEVFFTGLVELKGARLKAERR